MSLNIGIIALLNIILNFILIPKYGIWGASFATLICHGTFFLFSYSFAQKYYHIPYEIGKLLTMIGVGILFFICPKFIGFPNYINLLFKIFLLIIYPIIIGFFHFYEPIELLRLKQSWKKWRNPKNWKNNISKINFR